MKLPAGMTSCRCEVEQTLFVRADKGVPLLWSVLMFGG